MAESFRGRVVYVGNFEPVHSTETHVASALADLGCEVEEVQESKATVADIERICRDFDADLLLYTRTEGLTPSPRQDWLTFLDRLPIPSVSYHLDLYAGLKRGAGLRDDPFWRTRHVFSADGGSQAFFAQHGIDHRWLRAGVHGPECYLAAPDPSLATDVLFVGAGGPSSGYHPEWRYRDELLRFLTGAYGSRFSKHGHPALGPAGCRHVRGHKLNVAYASAKVVVGDSLCLGPDAARTPRFRHARYWSDRVYETMGRGGFLVMPRIEGLELEFTEGEHLAFYDFGDLDGLRRVIDRYLGDDIERERVRRAGHAKVRSACTYTHRMRELLAAIGLRAPLEAL